MDTGVQHNSVELTAPSFSDYAESEPEAEDATDLTLEETNEEQDLEPLAEPTRADIEPWMSPRRAREKQLLLDGQYRINAKCRKQMKIKDDTIENLRTRNSKLTTLYRCERKRRIAAEKTSNDILKMLK